jgi:starvation-inducible outer membrane lipoprotein
MEYALLSVDLKINFIPKETIMKRSNKTLAIITLIASTLAAAACSSAPKKIDKSPITAQTQQEQRATTPAAADLGAGSTGRGM